MTRRVVKNEAAQRRAMTRLCQKVPLPHARRAVLQAVVSIWWSHGKGVVHPGVSAIARKAGVSKRTAQYAMRDLEALGIVVPVAHRAGGRQGDGRGIATEFTVRDVAIHSAARCTSGELKARIQASRENAEKGASKGAKRVQGLRPVIGYRERGDAVSEAVRDVGATNTKGTSQGEIMQASLPPGRDIIPWWELDAEGSA